MATPDKKMKMSDDTETVNGYLHEVSPMKNSRNNVKYFNAIIQENDKYTNSVCFRPEFHQNMVQLQKQRSQVSLRKVDRVPSLQRSGDFDIKITYSSDLLTPKKSLDFDFQPPPSLNQVQTINHIKESLNAYQKTNVHVKVVQIGKVQTKTVRSGTSVSCQDVVVADKTGSITLCVWDKQTDTYSIEESYSMQNISVRKYDNIKSLTTCPDSIIKLIPDIGPVIQSEQQSTTTIKTLDVQSVSCISLNKCNICLRDVGSFNREISTVKCPHCQMRKKTSSLQETLKCELIASSEGEKLKLQISHSVLKNCTSLAQFNEPSLVETKILDATEFKAKLNIGLTSILEIIDLN